MRHTLNETMSPEEAVEQMIEGDEVAQSVLTEIINKHAMPGPVMLDMDDMNIRGEQIRIGMKICKGKIKNFVELIGQRSPWLVDEINKECRRHFAVTQGASIVKIRN